MSRLGHLEYYYASASLLVWSDGLEQLSVKNTVIVRAPMIFTVIIITRQVNNEWNDRLKNYCLNIFFVILQSFRVGCKNCRTHTSIETKVSTFQSIEYFSYQGRNASFFSLVDWLEIHPLGSPAPPGMQVYGDSTNNHPGCTSLSTGPISPRAEIIKPQGRKVLKIMIPVKVLIE